MYTSITLSLMAASGVAASGGACEWKPGCTSECDSSFQNGNNGANCTYVDGDDVDSEAKCTADGVAGSWQSTCTPAMPTGSDAEAKVEKYCGSYEILGCSSVCTGTTDSSGNCEVVESCPAGCESISAFKDGNELTCKPVGMDNCDFVNCQYQVIPVVLDALTCGFTFEETGCLAVEPAFDKDTVALIELGYSIMAGKLDGCTLDSPDTDGAGVATPALVGVLAAAMALRF
jgi:hypothetical protein